jgi:hypothetical protein
VLVDFAPGLFGTRADEIGRSLERIARNGRQRDVEQLQEQVAEWRDDGTLPASSAAIIQSALDQLVDDDEDDG